MIVLGIISDERALKSKSPAMHTAVMRGRGMDGVYLPFVVRPDQVGPAVLGLTGLGLAGANVTVPYKQAVMENLAAHFSRKRELERAARYFEQVLAMKRPTSIEFRFDYAAFLYLRGKKEAAVAQVEKLLEQFPDNHKALFSAGRFFAFIGDPARAIVLLEKDYRLFHFYETCFS